MIQKNQGTLHRPIVYNKALICNQNFQCVWQRIGSIMVKNDNLFGATSIHHLDIKKKPLYQHQWTVQVQNKLTKLNSTST
ncbi:uncharacterized protein CYBJADRAFT_84251 [Cyberlindnera jadinii NRRL Y-1542]|uniref:Uncharacterized protein n=1 Tax=Cyberlindnera jadinii (strain ATCC 18201 / CBS 1600 / BCRC 20928 / JCM 3617 / NBRC 0987 / NRRL Y-1542) TaxID=983966 RepID=A0A1E4S206_CYBJN|nr:hypothetical protein CYBJADRAFT_84251 [Cyberlindnera jadinii NRRL Y-1542]ODV73490.1 hypothetical protein CYBJADRAFT_84251 [Cyberlindnera jadinii NRRL Y-1542]